MTRILIEFRSTPGSAYSMHILSCDQLPVQLRFMTNTQLTDLPDISNSPVADPDARIWSEMSDRLMTVTGQSVC